MVFCTSAVVGFTADEKAVTPAVQSSTSIHGDKDENDLFAWAKQHGAKIADSIEIRSTIYGGRGLFAKTHIAANTELIEIPYHLQLGARQLAEGSDEEMQTMARNLPWRYIMQNELFFVPLSIAVAAERRKGTDSLFCPFLQSLPECANAVSEKEDDFDLTLWAPHIAKTIQQRRLGIKTIHESGAPTSLSIEELRWATSNVCSRSLLRKRIKELTPDQVNKIGAFCASDHSRMLPIIDLVNHGSLELSNVWVGHISRDGNDTNDFSTSLKSTRDIQPGEELLFDYGGGKMISNDRLLLDYGFVLPGHLEYASISLEDFSAAISEMLGADRLKDVSATEMGQLRLLITTVTQQASKTQQNMPILFTSDGEPSIYTHVIAICMTCRDKDDVKYLLNAFDESKEDVSSLSNKIFTSCSNIQKEFARYALKVAAGFVVVNRLNVQEEDKEGSFANVCRDYSKMCRETLQRVADMSS